MSGDNHNKLTFHPLDTFVSSFSSSLESNEKYHENLDTLKYFPAVSYVTGLLAKGFGIGSRSNIEYDYKKLNGLQKYELAKEFTGLVEKIDKNELTLTNDQPFIYIDCRSIQAVDNSNNGKAPSLIKKKCNMSNKEEKKNSAKREWNFDEIARKFDVTLESILESNQLKDELIKEKFGLKAYKLNSRLRALSSMPVFGPTFFYPMHATLENWFLKPLIDKIDSSNINKKNSENIIQKQSQYKQVGSTNLLVSLLGLQNDYNLSEAFGSINFIANNLQYRIDETNNLNELSLSPITKTAVADTINKKKRNEAKRNVERKLQEMCIDSFKKLVIATNMKDIDMLKSISDEKTIRLLATSISEELSGKKKSGSNDVVRKIYNCRDFIINNAKSGKFHIADEEDDPESVPGEKVKCFIEIIPEIKTTFTVSYTRVEIDEFQEIVSKKNLDSQVQATFGVIVSNDGKLQIKIKEIVTDMYN